MQTWPVKFWRENFLAVLDSSGTKTKVIVRGKKRHGNAKEKQRKKFFCLLVNKPCNLKKSINYVVFAEIKLSRFCKRDVYV